MTELTEIEKYMLKTHELLNSLGIKHFLTGSSLLASQREKRLIEGDKEINFGFYGEDVYEVLDKLRPLFTLDTRKTNHSKYGCTYLLPLGFEFNEPYWKIEPAFTLISPHYFWKTKAYQVIEQDYILTWPRETLDTLDTVNFLGVDFLAPHTPEKWLSTYYGKDWTVRNPSWNWISNARNLKNYHRYIKN